MLPVVDAPPPPVIRSFGGDATRLHPLAGGEGQSWRAGGVVLKPAGRPDELAWIAQFVAGLECADRIRVASQLRCSHGLFVCGGWAATAWLDGGHRSDRWSETRRVAAVFHEAAARSAATWPDFMRVRRDPWSRATRVAWDEEPRPRLPRDAASLVDEMVEVRDSVADTAANQVIHSDLAGNVLFSDDLPPAVIDISPQFRSVAYAEAILVSDAVAWSDAAPAVLSEFLEESVDHRADVARAVIFRVATAALAPGTTPDRVDREADAYRRMLAAVRWP